MIPAAPAYGVYISQLIRYSRACISCQDFLDRGLLLTRKLLNQGDRDISIGTCIVKSENDNIYVKMKAKEG
jgi:hypothetical protein